MPKVISSNTPGTVFRKRPVKGTSVYVSEDIITKMTDHAESGYRENKEVMGLLIGHILTDDEGTYVRVENTATSELEADEVSVRFKKDSMGGLFDSIDRCLGDAVVGWYHSHLGIGCYLSEVDIKTHTGIFAGDIGFAVVIDPSDSTLAVFSCDGDGPKKVPMIVFS